jgi:endo-beta-N-acetylglucosaminidase D
MRTKQVLLSILVISTASLVQGCLIAAVGVGAGTIAYVRGDLEAVESARLDVVYEATLKAVEKLQLSVTTKSKDAMSAVIVARDAQDKKITITLKAVTEEATKLYIRVGVFGSETKSRLIYQEIHESLPR